MLRIGIDVGGTNTDAVAIEGGRVVAQVKRQTTEDILSGVAGALGAIVRSVGADDVHSVVIGTTQFMNAILEARRLSPVVAIRLATVPQPLEPMADWPDTLRSAVAGGIHVRAGGHQFTGQPMNAFDEDGVREIARAARASGQDNFMVSSVFSPVNPDGEVRARDVINAVHPEAKVTLSSEIGRIGLLERENAAILNAALRPLAARVVDGLVGALLNVGLNSPLYLSQNDGTVVNLDVAREYPIFTIASGPTNSMRGAAVESDQPDCVVVDIGGTTTDVGLLQAGFPRESAVAVELGGVRTNFRMPDVASLSIGGGSVIRGHGDGTVTVGPDSVGHELTREALVFGGQTLTLTDIAVAAGLADIGERDRVHYLDDGLVAAVMEHVRGEIGGAIDRTKLADGDVPVVAVGGGSVLLGDSLPGVSRLLRPANAAVANAIGAARASIGGEVDRVFSLADQSRADALQAAREEARARAVQAGAAAGSVRIIDEEDVPLTHLPEGTATRVRVRAIGDIADLEVADASA
jgi:N-methylhydantoinase A/oxoprolinase/acetone carboxylase beta subunit